MIDARGTRVVDRVSTTGVDFDEVAERWVRATSARHGGLLDCEILEFRGGPGAPVMSTLGVVVDAHDVAIVGATTLVVDSYNNTVVELLESGSRPIIALPGEPDSWHLNSIVRVDDELFASAFRRGGTFRQWHREIWGTGIIFSTQTGAVVATELSAPHSPRFIDGSWVVCNSRAHELALIESGFPARRQATVDCGGFTRGLDFDDHYFYVGVSARRTNDVSEAASGAAVVVVDRQTLQPIDRIPCPMSEIYDVRIVPQGASRLLAMMSVDLLDEHPHGQRRGELSRFGSPRVEMA